MPRKSKTQKIETAPNQAYGVANEQKQAMNVVPLPDTTVIPNPNETSALPMNPINGDQIQSPSLMDIAAAESPPTDKAFSDPTAYPEQSLMTPPNMAMTEKRPSRVAAMLRSIGANSSNPQDYERMALLAERTQR